MTFLVSNYPLANSNNIKSVYIKGDYYSSEKGLLILKGKLFPENNMDQIELLEKINKNGIDVIKKLKGYFCGVYFDLNNEIIYFFTDKIRYFDLFFYFSKDFFLISDKFSEILQTKLFSIDDINQQALLEFVIFEYPILGKTFINGVNFVPLGTIYKIDVSNNKIEKETYFSLIFKPNPDFYKNKRYDILEKLFDTAMIRIKGLFPTNTTYGLGLSGGLDSRLTAYLAKKHDMSLRTFIFGERNTDAYYIARKIAKELNIEHYELGYDRDFFKYCNEGMKYNPMMSVYYSWYYAIFKRLPKFDILLTGFFGGGQVGALHSTSDIFIENDNELANKILIQYFKYERSHKALDYFKNKSLIFGIKNDLIEFSKKSPNSEYWCKIEEFNYNRQLTYIKNNPSFNFYGIHELNLTILTDPDIVDFLLELPPDLRLERIYYIHFFKERIPSLYRIRRERYAPEVELKILKKILKIIYHIDRKLKIHFFTKKSHKAVEKWLSHYDQFSNYIKDVFDKENSKFNEIIYINKISHLISKKKWNGAELCLIFRFLTIKLFLNIMINLRN